MSSFAIKPFLIRAAALFVVSFMAAITVNAQQAQATFAAGEILVKFKKVASPDDVSSLLENMNGRSVETLGDLGWQRVAIPKGESVEAAIVRYQRLPLIEAAQPNFYYSLQATPNDPQFTESTMHGLFKISAPQAWDIVTGSSAIVVANIDSGIRYTHEDLAANMWVNPGETPGNVIDDDGNGFVDDVYGYDFRYNDPDPTDEHGHGTHTAGTLGAVGNNSVGVVGINWNVKLMAIKIYSAAANDTTSAMLINAYNYVRKMKNRGVNIRVTNNSYGGCPETCGEDKATRDAIDALGDAGILNVFAAGNAGTNIENTPFYPASYRSPSIISVAASNLADNRASFSNFGPISVDIAAPGAGIYSTTCGSPCVSDSSYGLMAGTSMATPHVAGAAALLAGHDPSLTPASLKATLMNNVDVLPQWNGLVKTGGRLNVFAALQNPTVCNIGFGSDNILVPTKGASITINITASTNCDYLVKSNVNWITVQGNAERSANSSLNLRIRLNPTITRSGTVRIGDRTITIRQNRGGN